MVAYFIFIVKVSYLMCQTLLYTPLCMDFREMHFKKKKKREIEKQEPAYIRDSWETDGYENM